MSKKLRKIAIEIKELEDQCQKNIDVTDNMKKMEDIMLKLSLDELFELILFLEK